MKLKQYISSRISPIHKVLFSFLLLICVGAILLKLPFATHNGISLIDSLFTSTSAVCVTGLIVVDTAKDFTLFGQFIILLLMQFGGLGIMTFSIALLALVGGSFSMKWRFTFESFYNDVKKLPVKSILKRIVFYTFVIEGIITIILFTQFIRYFPFGSALWHSVFHSVSAFCNAGFSTFSDSLVGFRGNTIILTTLSVSIILGGLGFVVLAEVVRVGVKKVCKGVAFKEYSLHTKIVLITSLFLLVFGMVSTLLLEWDYTLAGMTVSEKLLNSFFHSVSSRTAGFNTVNIGHFHESTLLITIGLMFIGGSPGSIAGGIKTTTIFVILWLMLAKFKGKKQVVFMQRALSTDIINRSTMLIILSMFFIYTATVVLLLINSLKVEHKFLSSLFEITSAFCTVGLSTGVTGYLTAAGKTLICVVMFAGRLGPLTLLAALTANARTDHFEFTEENIMIG